MSQNTAPTVPSPCGLTDRTAGSLITSTRECSSAPGQYPVSDRRIRFSDEKQTGRIFCHWAISDMVIHNSMLAIGKIPLSQCLKLPGCVARIFLCCVCFWSSKKDYRKSITERCCNSKRESQPTSEITPPHASAFHLRTRPRPAYLSGSSRADPSPDFLRVFTRAQRTSMHVYPKH